jgi:hypothetical protein
MSIRSILILWLLISVAAVRYGFSQDLSMDAALAGQYLREAKEACDRDAGRLWGVELYGPVLLVNPATREIVANQADAGGLLQRSGEVFTGRLPKEVNIANTSVDWAGVRWAMIMWPLPEERQPRLRLMVHELFHRVQKDVNSCFDNSINNHLDKVDARIWLRLEMRALERALQEQGEEQRRAIADALYFRQHRQSLFAQSANAEDSLELNEGLAEYTGFKLSARSQSELAARIGYNLLQAQYKTSFIRSFAYATGPAYGCLLDRLSAKWRQKIRAKSDCISLSALMQLHLYTKLPKDSESVARARAMRYDGDEVISAESRRDRLWREQSALYRARLLEGPSLLLPTTDKINYSFNPNNLISLDEAGTVYPTLRAVDEWGILEVSDGALLCLENGRLTKIRVAAPESLNGATIQGKGWKLELNENWMTVPAERSGDYLLKRK